ncbi:MAG: transketolase [Myxococcota bacterium]
MDIEKLRADRPALIAHLRRVTAELRVDILEMLCESKSGHPGASLSSIDLIAALFYAKMRFRPEQPEWPDRDRFVLSKGHGVPALYAVLAHFGVIGREELKTLRKHGSRLQGHPANRLCPGMEASTGSLGQGLSVAQGLALASRLDGDRFRVYCMIGDGESQVGQIWEAAMSAPKFALDHLCVLADYNQGQNDKLVREVMPTLEPAADKWRAFNWHVVEIDGHDIAHILGALDEAERTKGKPTLILARTIKGKGVSFMELNMKYHGVAPSPEETQRAIAEIRGRAS